MMAYIYFFIAILVSPTLAGQAEYCQFDILNTTCKPDQVILMEHAQYGRMHLGRCVTESFGHIGCAANVLDLLDSDCSGKQKCTYEIPLLRDLIQPCPDDLTSYLEARHSCINVYKIRRFDCNRVIHLNATASTRYLSSDLLDLNTRHSVKCPVVIHTLPGQTLNFTIYKFGRQRNSLETYRNPCPIQVSFIEADGSGRDVTECDLSHRQQHVYSSTHNAASVIFHEVPMFASSHAENYRILLEVEASGCADLASPPNAWVQRLSDKAIIRCNHTQDIFYMTCKDNSWSGHITTCTAGNTGGHAALKGHISAGMIVAVTISVILGAMCGIGMLIAVFIYRHRRHCSASTPKMTSSLLGRSRLPDDTAQDNDENYVRRVWVEHKQTEPHGRVCHGHNVPMHYSFPPADSHHMAEFKRSVDHQVHTMSSHKEILHSPYECAHNARSSGVPNSADDARSDTYTRKGYGGMDHPYGSPYTLRSINGDARPIGEPSVNSSESASSETRQSGRGTSNYEYSRPINLRSSGRTFSSLSQAHFSVPTDDMTSPEHQPDVVSSNHNNVEEGANVS